MLDVFNFVDFRHFGTWANNIFPAKLIKYFVSRGHGARDPLFGSAGLVLGNFPGMGLMKQQTT